MFYPHNSSTHQLFEACKGPMSIPTMDGYLCITNALIDHATSEAKPQKRMVAHGQLEVETTGISGSKSQRWERYWKIVWACSKFRI